MSFRFLNIYLFLFWAFLALALLFRHQLLPNLERDPVREQQLDLLSYLAIALTLWNLFRIQMGRRERRRQQQWEEYRRRTESPQKENPAITDPQFQFDKTDS